MTLARLSFCRRASANSYDLKLRESVLLALCFLQPLSTTFGQESAIAEKSRLVPATGGTCVTAGGETRLKVKLTGVAEARPVVQWTVSTDRGQLLGRYSKVSVNERPGGDVLVNLEFPMPPLKPGVVLPLSLQVSAVLDGQTHQQTLSLNAYSAEAFSRRDEMFERLRIQLFDPEGETAELFDEHNIPYTRLINLAAIDLVVSETLVVGEGVSLRDYRTLGQSLAGCAQRGGQVLCLAPREDDFPLVLQRIGSSENLPRITLDRSSVVRAFDKRFDVDQWGGEPATTAGFIPTASESDLAFNMSQDRQGWPWVSLEYNQAGIKSIKKSPSIEKPGRLILCGFGILSRWEDSPVPRYLLAHLFDEFAGPETRKENQDNVPSQP